MTLDDMIDVALKRNLDLMVKAWEFAIQEEAATGAKLDLLPELLVTGDRTQRSNKPSSTSKYSTGTVAPPSVSDEQRRETWNIKLTWNLLDFGISYFRSRQEANRVLMDRLEYQRMRQNIILEITQNYWSAVVNKEAMQGIKEYLDEIQTHQVVLERAANSSLISKTPVLEMRDQYAQKALKYQEYEKDYLFAKSELARLMGLPPCVQFDIAYDCSRPLTVKLPDIYELEECSLIHRPELYSLDAEEKINADDVRLAILSYIPGVSLFSSRQHDENRYLVHKYWSTVGAQAVWDLLSIPAGISHQCRAEKQVQLTKKNRLALSIGAMTQVNLAYLVYNNDLDQYLLALNWHEIKQKLLDSALQKRRVGKYDLSDILDYKAGALEAKVRLWKSYGNMQFSLEKLNNAMGLPLCYRNNQTTTLCTESPPLQEVADHDI